MKCIYFIFLVFLIASCSDDESNTNACVEQAYKELFTVALNDEICFPNGSSLKITKIESAHCQCNIYCDYGGDFIIGIEAQSAAIVIENKEFYTRKIDLNTSIFKNYEINNFSINYQGSTEIPFCIDDFNSDDVTLSFSVIPE
ncbi:MAG: hypothetical protein P1U56_09860 [Saprospiraceae bacterium]|nr:hypothetical protein [Saprospiraceae bacterium]